MTQGILQYELVLLLFQRSILPFTTFISRSQSTDTFITLLNIRIVSRFGRGLSNPSRRFSLVIVFARQVSDTDKCFFDH